MKNKLLIIFIIIAAIVLFGIILGYFYSLLPGHNPQKNEQACESVGGEWSGGLSSCLLADKKAGASCTDGAQCESGICFPPDLSEEQEMMLDKEPIKNIAGTCYPDNFPTGCVKQVVMGTVSKASMCPDD